MFFQIQTDINSLYSHLNRYNSNRFNTIPPNMLPSKSHISLILGLGDLWHWWNNSANNDDDDDDDDDDNNNNNRASTNTFSSMSEQSFSPFSR